MVQATRLQMVRADEKELRKWLRSSRTRRSLAERAKIVLLSREGLSAAAIGEKLGVTRLTVYKWRRRFQEGGLEALADRPRPVLVSCRPVWEGGRFRGSEEERHSILRRALDLGADWVDLEWRGGFEALIAEHCL